MWYVEILLGLDTAVFTFLLGLLISTFKIKISDARLGSFSPTFFQGGTGKEMEEDEIEHGSS